MLRHDSYLALVQAASLALVVSCTPPTSMPDQEPTVDQPAPSTEPPPALRVPAPRERQPCGNDAMCTDGLSCNGLEVCVDGICQSGSAIDCADDDPCTTDTCVEQSAGVICMHDTRACPAPLVCRPETGVCGCVEGADCDDGDACTTGETCIDGACAGGTRRACDDGSVCTLDGCDIHIGCIHQPIIDCIDLLDDSAGADDDTDGDGSADDGGQMPGGGDPNNPSQDACAELDCNDTNPCTTDVCSNGTCTNTPNTAPCDDGDACTHDDLCADGACVPGEPMVCDDGNPCTTDICAPLTGCTAVADDDNTCNESFPCLDEPLCVDGTCTGAPLADGSACDDANSCTFDDVCAGSACLGVPTAGCVPCTTVGECDSDACTVNDACVDGMCSAGQPRDCDDANPCTSDSCEPQGGCIYTADIDVCDDGNECTTNDTCILGSCIGTVVLGCGDVPGVFFVKADATGQANGSTWVDAFTEVQAALAAIEGSGGAIDEIWVAAGTYRPDYDALTELYTEDRNATFELPPTVTLRGGFGGFETTATRALAAHPTVLSGDLGIPGDPTDNTYHIVTATNVTTTLEGFILTAGNADGHAISSGGGILIENGAPTVTQCWMIDNAGLNAGGLYTIDSAAWITACRFLGNAGTGASSNGGALNIQGGEVTVSSCVFSGNSAAIGAGLIAGGTPRIINCTFSGNAATSVGAGVYVLASASATIANCIFWNNADLTGLTESAQITALGNGFTVSHSIVHGLSDITGPGNSSMDPMFRNPDGPDGLPGTADDDVRLRGGSPAIDAGDSGAVDDAIDVSGLPRRVDDACSTDAVTGGAPAVDVGAHESNSCPN